MRSTVACTILLSACFVSTPALAVLLIEPPPPPIQIAPVHVPAEHVARMDLVSIQRVSVESVSDIGFEDLANISADKNAADSDEVSLAVTVASSSVPEPPQTIPVSVSSSQPSADLNGYSPASGSNPVSFSGGLVSGVINSSATAGLQDIAVTGGGVDFAPLMIMDSFAVSGSGYGAE